MLVKLYALGDRNNWKTFSWINYRKNKDIDTIGKLIDSLQRRIDELLLDDEDCKYDPILNFKYVRLQPNP